MYHTYTFLFAFFVICDTLGTRYFPAISQIHFGYLSSAISGVSNLTFHLEQLPLYSQVRLPGCKKGSLPLYILVSQNFSRFWPWNSLAISLIKWSIICFRFITYYLLWLDVSFYFLFLPYLGYSVRFPLTCNLDSSTPFSLRIFFPIL